MSFSFCWFLQATEDARKVAEEERAIALAEIEKAKAAIKRVEQALEEHELSTTSTENQVKFWLRSWINFLFTQYKLFHRPSPIVFFFFLILVAIQDKTPVFFHRVIV